MRLLSVLTSLLGVVSCSVIPSPLELDARGLDGVAARAAAASVFSGKQMRILPLGGMYWLAKCKLKQWLSPATVTYIGTQCSGEMQNGNNEGHPGFVISQMQNVSKPDLTFLPNIVLLYVGTNDMLYPVDPANAPQRLASLVQTLSKSLPGSLFIVGNLFLDTDPVVQSRINTFNAALPGALSPLQKQGINVQLADFSSALNKSDLHCDGEHPNDTGYQIMAYVFWRSLYSAASSNKIPTPKKITTTQSLCKPAQPTPTGVCSTSTTTSQATATATSPTNGTIVRGKLAVGGKLN